MKDWIALSMLTSAALGAVLGIGWLVSSALAKVFALGVGWSMFACLFSFSVLLSLIWAALMRKPKTFFGPFALLTALSALVSIGSYYCRELPRWTLDVAYPFCWEHSQWLALFCVGFGFYCAFIRKAPEEPKHRLARA